MDERARIGRFLEHPTTPLPAGSIGPGDDAASIPMPDGRDLVATTDLVSEGTHFFSTAAPRLIGRFAATVNLSDLAAMGARPHGFLVAYGVPRDDDPAWSEGVAAGLAEALDAVRCPLIGGDTKEAGCRTVVGTALGTVPRGTAVRRGGAIPGDMLVLTGPVGGTAAALALHARGALDDAETMRHVLGRAARLAEGEVLREAGATAMVDLSDGLARSAGLMADASGARLVLEAERIPLDPLVQRLLGPRAWTADADDRRLVVGTGGEYELLAAVPRGHVDDVLERVRSVGTDASMVGQVEAGPSGAVLRAGTAEHPLGPLGWTHFS